MQLRGPMLLILGACLVGIPFALKSAGLTDYTERVRPERVVLDSQEAMTCARVTVPIVAFAIGCSIVGDR